MGLAGSDAADIVLTDDNFASIVAAVEARPDGRRIFANVVKFLVHLLSGNVAEARPVIVLVVGLVFGTFPKQDDPAAEGYVFPMTAIQVLYLNMVTGTPADIALGAEAASPDLMLLCVRLGAGAGWLGASKPPKSAVEGLFTPELVADTAAYGLAMGAFSLASFCVVIFWYYDGDYGVECDSYSDVFGLAPISWEWALLAGSVILLFLFSEGYKARPGCPPPLPPLPAPRAPHPTSPRAPHSLPRSEAYVYVGQADQLLPPSLGLALRLLSSPARPAAVLCGPARCGAGDATAAYRAALAFVRGKLSQAGRNDDESAHEAPVSVPAFPYPSRASDLRTPGPLPQAVAASVQLALL
eukprot:tig00000836_g4686.t1